MATSAYADPQTFFGISVPKVRQQAVNRSLYGDLVLIIFLLAQCFDGVFTYVGVSVYGLAVEANPLIATLMANFGHGAALAMAKGIAALLGICLHLRQVHGAVAMLAFFYASVAIMPWVAILFFQ